jgi:glycosyltransferase involved in cell wall biosynthesis
MLDGEGARVIEEAGAGFTCAAESPRELAEAVLKMRDASTAQRAAMGAAGRLYYRATFEREALFDRLMDWVTELTLASTR